MTVFDGACAFCAWWVRYWQRLSGDRVRYRRYQAALDDFPELTAAECAASIQLVRADGSRASGAGAAFAVLELAGISLPAWLYRHCRPFRFASEWSYRFVARRRGAFFVLARALWGNERYPARYARASHLFPRLLGAVFVAAFLSLAAQVTGLVGTQGIVPAVDFLERAHDRFGAAAWHRVPTVFWLDAGNASLVAACVIGAAAGALAALGRGTVAALAVCYLAYLSLFSVGQPFMGFQWDLLLLEAGLLALWLPLLPRAGPWLFRLLLFRFMFLSGCVKLLSGDPSWASLNALDFHYETQPLPTPLAWHAALLPAWFDRLCVAATLAIEVVLPLLVFAPRRPRMLAAGGFIVLEVAIVLTGNYNFFNLLTLALVLFLFDDAQFGDKAAGLPAPGSRTRRRAAAGLVLLLVTLNLMALFRPFTDTPPPRAVAAFADALRPLRAVNTYGLFAVMTTSRPEIEIQGSADGRSWQPYRLPYKPGAVERPLAWNLPHQPRLDWQLWFAALSSADREPWFGNLLYRLLTNEPTVTALLAENPFAAAPPRYVRALLHDYRFTSRAERDASGAVWHREPLGLYYPPVALE
ncbi:MAG: lipase maturation factor family protein [Gammaproteobacteria bacterium]